MLATPQTASLHAAQVVSRNTTAAGSGPETDLPATAMPAIYYRPTKYIKTLIRLSAPWTLCRAVGIHFGVCIAQDLQRGVCVCECVHMFREGLQ